MKSEKFLNILIFPILIVFLCLFLKSDFGNNLNTHDLSTYSEYRINTSAPHLPILITNNTELDTFPDKTGLGTEVSPYIIEDMEITGSSTQSCIEIRNTDKYLVIKNCTLHGALGTNGGIRLEKCSNVNLTGNYIFSSDCGIILDSSNTTTIIKNNALVSVIGINSLFSINNTIIENNITSDGSGIAMVYSDNNTWIKNNIMTDLGGRGIYMVESYNNMLSGNNASGGTCGIYLSTSSFNTITGNYATSSAMSGYGITLYGTSNNNTLRGNDIVGNFASLYIYLSSNNEILENNISGGDHGVFYEFADNNNRISANNVTGTVNGIYLYWSSNNIIASNNITASSGSGISLDSHSELNTIEQNNATGRDTGISLVTACDNNTITKNNATGMVYGIYLSGSSDNFILENKASMSNTVGIQLQSSSINNTISGNIVSGNSDAGILLDGSCNNNIISGNNATNNSNVGICLRNACDGNIISINQVDGGMRGITLESCSSNRILGNYIHRTTDKGLSIVWSGNVTISRNNIFSQGIGIYFEHAQNDTISGNNVTGATAGIFFSMSDFNNIVGNNISSEVNGIYFEASTYNWINANTVTSTFGTGIGLSFSSASNQIDFNNITGKGIGISFGISNSNTVLWNNISCSWISGIYCFQSSYNQIQHNNITGGSFTIHLNSSFDCTVAYNTITDSGIGIMVQGSTNNWILNNSISGAQDKGIMLSTSSSSNHIIGNNASSNGTGIVLYSSCISNTISDNNFTGRIQGLYMANNCNANLVSENSMDGTDYGLFLEDCSDNTIKSNNLTSDIIGIYLLGSNLNNSISLNRFYASIPAMDDGTAGTMWDNVGLGNWYPDYRSKYTNATHNGVYWNIPYNITGATSSIDNYPLYISNGIFPIGGYYVNPYGRVVVNDWIQINFTGYDADTPTTFQWYFGDGTVNSTVREPVHQYTTVGEYYITQMVMDRDGDYVIYTDFIIVDADIFPVANIYANQTILFQDGWIQFVSTGPYGNSPPTIFRWDFGDGTSISSLQCPVHHFTSIGNFTVTNTIEDANGDQDVDTILIQVLADLVPIATFTPDRITIIAGETIQFNFTGFDGNAPAQFQWNFGDGTGNSTVRDPTHQFVVAGNFTVILTIEDANGDQNVSTIAIEVLIDLILVSAFISGNTTIISGGVIQFNFTGVDGNAPAQFQWNFGDGTGNSSLQNPAHQFASVGNFTVILTIEDTDGDQDVSTIVIEVLADLVPVGAFSADRTTIIAGETIQFIFTGIDGNTPAQFQWNFSDGTGNSSARDPAHQFTLAGTFSIILTISDANGNSSTVILSDLIVVLAAFADSDGDGLSNQDEMVVYGTNPLIPDTDDDGYTDGDEINAGSDPLNPESIPQTENIALIIGFIVCSCAGGLFLVLMLHKKRFLQFKRSRDAPVK
jgi:parallel beta-helix repeat protein